LVCAELSVLASAGLIFWWSAHVWLLPCAAVGHMIGLKMHDQLIANEHGVFKQVIGAVLIAVCLMGLLWKGA
jgi:hypothetical protein